MRNAKVAQREKILRRGRTSNLELLLSMRGKGHKFTHKKGIFFGIFFAEIL